MLTYLGINCRLLAVYHPIEQLPKENLAFQAHGHRLFVTEARKRPRDGACFVPRSNAFRVVWLWFGLVCLGGLGWVCWSPKTRRWSESSCGGCYFPLSNFKRGVYPPKFPAW